VGHKKRAIKTNHVQKPPLIVRSILKKERNWKPKKTLSPKELSPTMMSHFKI
jgi:hypothetical protein